MKSQVGFVLFFLKQQRLNADLTLFLILQTHNTISPLPVAASSEGSVIRKTILHYSP